LNINNTAGLPPKGVRYGGVQWHPPDHCSLVRFSATLFIEIHFML